MTVSVQSPVIEYIASGATTAFSYPFLLIVSSDLKVYIENILVASGYSVSGLGNDEGGTVTFTEAPAAGLRVKLLRSTPLNRTTDYVEGGALRADVLDDDIDRVVMQIQDVRADAASTVEFAALLDETNAKLDATSTSEANAAASAVSAAASATAAAASAAIATAHNVLNFGAIGDGVADDTPAFLAAMAAASAAGGAPIYVPAGDYRITSQLNNSGPRSLCMGIVGDSASTSKIIYTTATGDGIVFNNPPVALRFEHFRLVGPGQAAPVTARGLSLPVDGLGPFIISFQVHCLNVTVEHWPTAGFYWQLPIVSTYTNCVAQECGNYGFQIDTHVAEFVGGTSTQFNACYANNVLGSGFWIKSHGYSAMSSCAADNCNISYHLLNNFGFALLGCGSEVNTYIDAARPGHAVVLSACYGGTIDDIWSYNLPNVLSRQLVAINSQHVTVRGFGGYQDNAVAPPYNAYVDEACDGIVFIANSPTRDDIGFVTPKFAINDLGARTLNMNDGEISGLEFKTANAFGNSVTVANGGIAVTALPGAGYLNLFQNGLYDYPVTSVGNDGTIVFGTGAVAQDTVIQRQGVNLISLPKVTPLTIEGAANPGLNLSNTTASQAWAVVASNTDDLAIYDSTGDSTTALFRPIANGGRLELANGLGAPDGSAASPSITFTAQTATGIYRAGWNQVGIAGGGTDIAKFTTWGSGDKNHLVVQSSPAGNGPTFSVAGPDTNIPAAFYSKGNGGTFFGGTNGTDYWTNMRVMYNGTPAGTSNHLVVGASNTGFSATIGTDGVDTDVSIYVTTKGAGEVLFDANTAVLAGSLLTVPAWSSVTNGTQTLQQFVDGAVTGSVAVPAGGVSYFAMNSAPTGWLKANGAAVSRTAYASLFTAIGTTFGVGDGSTTFNVPDMRGEFPRGWDDGRGVDSGRAFGSAQTDGIKSSYFGMRYDSGGVVLAGAYGGITGEFSVTTPATGATGTVTANATTFSSITRITLGSATETRPRNIALLACIKY